MSQWKNARQADGSPIWGPATLNKAPTADNRDALFNNSTADQYHNGQTHSVIGLKASEINSKVVIGVDVTNAGTGYTARPTVSFASGGGSGAAADAFAKAVLVALNGPGTGGSYVPGEHLSVSGGTGTATVANVVSTEVRTVAVVNGGTGYTNNDVVTLNTGTGTAATFTVTTGAADTTVASLALTTRGIYTSNPTLVQCGTTSADAEVSNGLTVTVTMRVKAISTVNAGSYSVLPTLSGAATTGSAAGTGATLDLTMGVDYVAMSNTGLGYTSAPTVTFGGAGGSGSTGTAVVTHGTVVAQPGWILQTVGSGGRAGRVQTEVLVANKNIS